MYLEVVMHDICNGLGVSSGPRSTTVYAVVDVGKLVRYTVGLWGSALNRPDKDVMKKRTM